MSMYGGGLWVGLLGYSHKGVLVCRSVFLFMVVVCGWVYWVIEMTRSTVQVCVSMVVVCGWVYWVIEMTEIHCAGLCVYLWWWFVGGFIG